jgi:hypothetical protein
LDLTPLQGRWYFRREDESEDLEQYLDVNEELFFRAVHFRRGGKRFKSQQVVLTIERLDIGSGDWEIDLRVARLIEDGRDRTSDSEGRVIRGRVRRDEQSLYLLLPEPGEPRPENLASAHRFERRPGL